MGWFRYEYWPMIWIRVGVAALAISALGMPVAAFLLRKMGVYDHVADNKLHKKPIPRGGGIMIFIAFAIAVLEPDYRNNPMKGVMLAGFICLVVGAIDDIRGGIPAVIKFVTLVVVTLIMEQFGVKLELFHIDWLNTLVTILWIVGVTSAINGIDNMDGLAAGVVTIIASMYFMIALQAYIDVRTENALSWFGMLSAGLIGANLGFLIHNFKPARIFMGDSGSFFLGFMVAALGVMGEWASDAVVSSTIPILILGVPLFDFAYIIIARILRGETKTIRQVIEHCALDHLSHRLLWLGFTQRQAVLFIYLISIAMGISGLLLRNSESHLDSALGLIQGLAVVTIIIVLMAVAAHHHKQANGDSSTNGDPAQADENCDD